MLSHLLLLFSVDILRIARADTLGMNASCSTKKERHPVSAPDRVVPLASGLHGAMAFTLPDRVPPGLKAG